MAHHHGHDAGHPRRPQLGRAAVLLVALTVCFAASSQAAAPAKATSTSAFLADTRSWTVRSSNGDRRFQISIALPEGYSRAHAPYPVLYVADANAEFGTVVETARMLAFAKHIPDLVIVGIGYAEPGQGFRASNAFRSIDLTPTRDPAWVRSWSKTSIEAGMPPPRGSGEASAFLGFLRTELIPSIEHGYNVSHQDRAWFGHSFGGLFGLYALLNNDGLFRRFVIGSPSLWWDDKAILAMEDAFAASHKPLKAQVFFSAGSLEQGSQGYFIASDLQAFDQRLKQRKYDGLDFETHIFDGEDHLSVIAATISRGLRSVYRDRPPS